MNIIEIPHGIDLEHISAEGYVRGEGVHASQLYGSLYKSLLPDRYDKRDEAGEPLPFDYLRMALGTAFELAVELILAQLLLGSRPDEFVAPHHKKCPHKRRKIVKGVACKCGAGIIFSPDQLLVVDGRMILGELKLTWMSPKGALNDEKFGKYLTQIMLYLYWLGMTECYLYIYFVNGKPDKSPVLRLWHLVFSEQELEEEYSMVMRHAVKVGLL